MSSSSYILKTIASQFDNPKESDLVFRVEGKSIYVHRQYLSMVSKHLSVMLSDKWTLPTQQEIIITVYNFRTFYTYLKYLYTGQVTVTSVNIKELYGLAHSYLEEELLQRCERYIRGKPMTETFYALIRIFGSDDAKQRYTEYAKNNSVQYSNYQLMAQIATDYQLFEVRRKIEKYLISVVSVFTCVRTQ